MLIPLTAAVSGVDISKPFVDEEKDRKNASSPPRLSPKRPRGADPIHRSSFHPNDSKALSQRIAAEAFVRCAKYAAIAFGITFVAPVALNAVNVGIPAT